MKTLLKNFTIVTMNENLDVLKDAHLIVEDGKITEVAAGAATGDFDEVIDGQNKQVLMPGLVNTHCHVPMAVSYTHLDVYKRQVASHAIVKST